MAPAFSARHSPSTSAALGWEVVVLTRQPHPPDATCARQVVWDGETLGPWAAEFEGAAAVINLAGRSVNCRYTDVNRHIIIDSRVKPTRVLGEAIARCKSPPRGLAQRQFRHALPSHFWSAVG